MSNIGRRKGIAILALGMLCLGQPLMAQDKPASMTISTASPGGVYAIYGEGIAKILSDTIDVPTSTRQTQGPAQNLVLLQAGQTDLAMVTTGPAYEAMEGKLELAPGKPYAGVRALFAMYPTPFQMVALTSSGIASLDDLNDKRVGFGPRAGTGGTYWPRWTKSMGIDTTAQFGGSSDEAGQLADGRLDAFLLAGGIPHPSITELETTQDVTIFGMSAETQKQILAANPYAVPFTIPASTYSSVDADLQTAAMWNFVVADAGMSEQLAYEITKAVLENNEALKATHAAAKDTVAENISQNTFIPIHPGAAKYYREIGVEVPDALVGK